jgi:hypothetical protein
MALQSYAGPSGVSVLYRTDTLTLGLGGVVKIIEHTRIAEVG